MSVRRLLVRAAPVVPMLDQALISGGNFLSGVVVARQLETLDFGVWVLANLLIWLAIPIQNGLTLQPLAVNGAGLGTEAFRRYLRASLPLQLGFIAVAGVVVGGAALLWEPVRPVALPVVVATAALLAQDYCRRVLYARDRLRSAVLCNVVNYDLQAGLLIGAALLGVLALTTAFWIMAATSLVALAIGVWASRDLWFGPGGGDVREVARQNFDVGKWTAASESVYVGSTHLFPALAAELAGVGVAAGLGVVMQILGVLNLLARPINNYFLPRAADAAVCEGVAGVRRVLRGVIAVALPPYGAVVLGLILVPGTVLHLMYGEKYATDADALRVFALAALLKFARHVVEVALLALRRQQLLLGAQLGGALALYGFGLVLLPGFGLLGAAVATAASSTVQLGVLVVGLARERRERERGAHHRLIERVPRAAVSGG